MAKFELEDDLEDINLMPIMNLLCLLIPFLLLSAQFIQIGIILVDTPRKSRVKDKKKDKDKKVMGLVIDITQEGYYISTKKGSVCPDRKNNGQPCIAVIHSGGEKKYRYDKLQKYLYTKLYKPNYKNNRTKKDAAFADWGKVTIRPQDQIEYDVVVHTLDASRELPNEAKGDLEGLESGSLVCSFKKPQGKKKWELRGNCMFPLAALGR
ncbi:MAG: biopolymer transporter ExbD [Myxococcota bacterium]